MERQNLAMRTSMRRLTAPANAFSKKLNSLMAAVAAHLAYCKFCRVNQSLRITGATEAGLASGLWSIEVLFAQPISRALRYVMLRCGRLRCPAARRCRQAVHIPSIWVERKAVVYLQWVGSI